jgi:hypothetical protein
VQLQPAALDRQLEASTVFGRRCALPKQEWRVDLLNGDPAVLHGLHGVGDLHNLAGDFSGIGIRPVSGEFHMPSLSPQMGRPRREKKRANAPKGEARFAPINGHRQPGGACPKSAVFVAKVFLGWRTKILRAADAFCARRREGPYIQNRSRTSVVALQSDAATEKSKDRLSRDF